MGATRLVKKAFQNRTQDVAVRVLMEAAQDGRCPWDTRVSAAITLLQHNSAFNKYAAQVEALRAKERIKLAAEKQALRRGDPTLRKLSNAAHARTLKQLPAKNEG